MTTDVVLAINSEELHYYQNLARQYSKRSLAPLFDNHDQPDGDLGLLPQIFQVALSTGIAASPELSMEGSAYGIWGSAVEEQGMLPSLLLLSIIAETCGAVAMSLHAQGVASNLVLQSKRPLPCSPVRVGLCLQEGMSPPYLGTIIAPHQDAPARIATTATSQAGSYAIRGFKSFVYSMPEVDAYVVFARLDGQWGCFLVPADDSRIEKTAVGPRTGLRSCQLEHVEFKQVTIPSASRMDDENARDLLVRTLCLSWAGMSAIALGIAKGAAEAARRYAAERYQGGTQIAEHPAVKQLMGGAGAAIRAAESSVFSLGSCDFLDTRSLAKAAAAKLLVTGLCARAVTECMQTFGGYGYMEDFRIEKRLRDVTVLKSALGSPLYLKQLISDIERDLCP
jgi:alkylation response protein AidB-like acyl-CoA dehydrogenase